MKKLSFIFHVLKETWQTLNKDRNHAKEYIANVEKFNEYLVTIYDNMEQLCTTVNQLCCILTVGPFLTKLIEITAKFETDSYSVFNENGEMNIMHGYYDDIKDIENRSQFDKYRMRKGLMSRFDNCISKNQEFLFTAKNYIKSHEYDKIIVEYEKLKKYIEQEDNFHGLCCLDIFKKIESGKIKMQ